MSKLPSLILFPAALLMIAAWPLPALASGPRAVIAGLAPHKAGYDIRLTATHGGSQILNISGEMGYEWKPSCGGWLTDHRFRMFYEYADAPGMRIVSDFSTFETGDGKMFDFVSRRKRDGEMYQEIRGQAVTGAAGGKAVFSAPEKMSYDLRRGTLFPAAHTIALIRAAQAGEKFFYADVFDGSDEDGPIEINAFIGKEVAAPAGATQADGIDRSLLSSRAWNVRMAVFQRKSDDEKPDYEMTMVFHENGIISDMVIEYEDFTVRQTLSSLEKAVPDSCGGPSGP